MSRQTRFLAALLAIVSLLTSQLALSSHACASMAQAAQASDVAGSSEPEDMNSSLCTEHCKASAASFDAAKPVPVPDVLHNPVLRIFAGDLPAAASSITAQRYALPPEPPPALRFSVLRI